MYTLGQAAKATGRRKSTISNAINSGKISAKKNEKGFWAIDPAELHRVYPPVSEDSTETVPTERDETVIYSKVLEAKLEALQEQLTREQDTVADLRRRLDKSDEERSRLTMMLTHQTEAPKKKTVLNRLFGIN